MFILKFILKLICESMTVFVLFFLGWFFWAVAYQTITSVINFFTTRIGGGLSGRKSRKNNM